MKIEDIAKQLANKVNQEHYILHYLKKIQKFSCGNCGAEPSDMYCEKCYHDAWDRVDN